MKNPCKLRFVKRILFIIIIPFLYNTGWCQDVINISGYVIDYTNGEKLIGANVYVPRFKTGSVTNSFGYYSLKFNPGNLILNISYVGYETKSISINLYKDTILNITLNPNIEIGEVIVKGERNNTAIFTGTNILLPDAVYKTPSLGGETDLMKSLHYISGIKQSQEGTSGIHVRGGSPDQNLILLDGVPVYNVNHLFGFQSVFNTASIKQVKVFKGGIPARYGNAISSVIDITMKEGNMKRKQGVFFISPIAASFAIEGPIKEDTSSYFISGRRTYADIPLRAYMKYQDNTQFGYYFYDFTIKANKIIDSRNKLFFSVYTGRDDYFAKYKDREAMTRYTYNWGNHTAVLRWTRIVTPSLFSGYSASYSKFSTENLAKTEIGRNVGYNRFISSMRDFSIAGNFDKTLWNNHVVRFGFKSSYQLFNPQIVHNKEFQENVPQKSIQSKQVFLNEIYNESEFMIGKLLSLNIGGRFSSFLTQGKHYWFFVPRLFSDFNVSENTSIKISYSRAYQFLHLLSNNSIGLPSDLWIPSTEKLHPSSTNQVSSGLFSHPIPGLSVSGELYFKKMNNVVWLNSANTFFDEVNPGWEDEIVQGKGRAYGAEIQITKTSGMITGSTSYTLSYSERKFEGVNNSGWFPYRYDQRHDIAILTEFRLKPAWQIERSFTAGFTFSTGNPVTIEDSEYMGMKFYTNLGDDGWLGLFDYLDTRNTFRSVNNYRMPTFHHLDLGYHRTRKLSENKSGTWSFSVYNIYNRLNPWYYYRKGNQLKQVSMFPIIPSVSYTYKW